MEIWWSGSPWTVLAAFLVALGMYFVVVVAFRAAKRRTVAELAPFDLATVIAVGAITGRTATGGNSVAVGLAAVVGLLLGHWLVSRMRRVPTVGAFVDHPTAVLVVDGRVRHEGLRRAGLTQGDLEAALRSHGVRRLEDVAVAVFETRHGVSVLLTSGHSPLWERFTEPG